MGQSWGRMGTLGELQLAAFDTCRSVFLFFRARSGALTLGLPILPVLSVPLDAFRATGPSFDWLVWAAYAEVVLLLVLATLGGAFPVPFTFLFLSEAWFARVAGFAGLWTSAAGVGRIGSNRGDSWGTVYGSWVRCRHWVGCGVSRGVVAMLGLLGAVAAN